jgi:hypothetical protein
MTEYIVKTFNTKASYQHSCSSTSSTIKINISNLGNITIEGTHSYHISGQSSTTHQFRPQKIIDNISVPKQYYNLIEYTVSKIGGEQREIREGIITSFLTDLKADIKRQHDEKIKKEEEIKQLKEQIANYEKIKSITIKNSPYLEKYYETDIDEIIKTEENENKIKINNAQKLIEEKFKKYKENRAIDQVI